MQVNQLTISEWEFIMLKYHITSIYGTKSCNLKTDCDHLVFKWLAHVSMHSLAMQVCRYSP